MSDTAYPGWVVGLAGDYLFSAAAGIASILSLFVTLWILGKLTRINAQIVLHGRSPRWLKILRDQASRLAPLLRDPEGARNEIREILIHCRPTLRALMRSSPLLSGQRAQVFRLLAKVGRYVGRGVLRWLSKRRPENELPRLIYEDLLEVNQSLSEAVAQARLFRPRV
jgi:hypothetical protein